jgi:hypothetical protein
MNAETNEFYKYIPEIIVIILVGFGLIFGIISSMYGRISSSKRKKLIESIVLAFWSALVPLLFGQIALTPIAGIIGGGLALYLSGGYVKYIYTFIGGVMGLTAGILINIFIDVVDIFIIFFEVPEIIHMGIMLLCITIGISASKFFKEYLTIIATSLAGASLFAFGILGLIFLIQNKSVLFLQNILVTAMIPFIGGFFEEVELYESASYLLSFILIIIIGFNYQHKVYQKELLKKQEK